MLLIIGWETKKKHKTEESLFIFVSALSPFILFVIYPFLHGIFLSFTNWTGLNTGSEIVVGFQNYKTIFTDILFLYAFWRTILYSVLNIVVINVVAFGLALIVTQNLKLKNIYRAGFFMPNLIGGLVLGYIWQFIFNRAVVTFGPAFENSFLSDSQSAMFALIFVVTWQYAGYIMMIYIAAIQKHSSRLN